LVPGRDVVGLDDHVFPGFEAESDLIVNGDQSIVDILAPLFTLDHSNDGALVGLWRGGEGGK
jgi:hypothetical protein